MQPLDPNDPIWKVLGRARPVDVRGNFIQNVVREARKTPQQSGLAAWWTGFRQEAAWLIAGRSAARFALAATVAGLTVLAVMNLGAHKGPESGSSGDRSFVATSMDAQNTVRTPAKDSSASVPVQPEVETEWENMAQMSALLAVEDTSVLSDSEIASILY